MSSEAGSSFSSEPIRKTPTLTLDRNLRKVSILLKALDEAGKSIDYYALDLSHKELERTLSDVPKFKNIVCRGLLGTYDDGLEWIQSGEHASRPKCILSLGSSIGNSCPTTYSSNIAHLFRQLSQARSIGFPQRICRSSACH